MAQVVLRTISHVSTYSEHRLVLDYTLTETATNYSITAKLLVQTRSTDTSKNNQAKLNNASWYMGTDVSNRVGPSNMSGSTVSIGTGWTTIGTSGNLTFSIAKEKETLSLIVYIGTPFTIFYYLNGTSLSSYYVDYTERYYYPLTIPTITTYAITYNANGGSGTTASQSKWHGEAITLRANGFTRSGYSFKRWNTKANDTGTGYNASASYTGNAALSLYAVWNRTVSYNANGGTGAPSAQTAVATSAITLTSAKPTRSGYTFHHWNTKADNSGTSYQSGGSYPANNASATLYAIWWKNPTVNAPTLTRCDAQGNADEVGGYIKATVAWSITASQVGETQTAPRSFTLTLTGDGKTFTDSPTLTGTSGTYATVLGDGTLGPNVAYSETATIADAHGTTTATGTLSPSTSYHAPIVTATAKLQDAGAEDPLCKRARVVVHYELYESAEQLRDASMVVALSIDVPGEYWTVDNLTGIDEVFTSDSHGYDKMDPHGGYDIGTATVSDRFTSTTVAVHVDPTDYTNPSITDISAFRTAKNEEVTPATYDESDDGTCLGVEVDWSTYRAPATASITVEDMEVDPDATFRVVARREYSLTGNSGSERFDVYPDATLWPDDHLEDGVLIHENRRYLVTVRVSDAYSDVVTSAKAYRAETITIAYFTTDALAGGRGYAIGKPATQELFDVGMPSNFDEYVKMRDELAIITGSITRGVVPSNNVWPEQMLAIRDSQEAMIGYLRAFLTTDGDNEGIQLETTRTVNGSVINHALRIGIDANGNRLVNVHDPAPWRNAIGAVNKAGDTINGTLFVTGGGWFVNKYPSIDRDGANPSADQWGTGLLIRDKDNADIGRVRPIRITDGYMYLRLSAVNEKTDGTQVENYFDIRIGRDGTQSYGMSSPANFRSAIGAQATIAASSGNGTRTSAAASDSSCSYRKWGRVCTVSFWIRVVSALGTWNSTAALYTGLPASAFNTNGFAIKCDANTSTYFANVNTGGQLYVSTRETSLPANTVVVGAFTYITAS